MCNRPRIVAPEFPCADGHRGQRLRMGMVTRRGFLRTVAAAGGVTVAATARAAGLQDAVDQGVTILRRFQSIPEQSIPAEVVRDAHGLAILHVIKAGFIFSGRVGQGVVVARTPKGWSGPSGITTGGAGFGFQIGAQVSEFVIVLNTPGAVKAFSQGGNVSLGGDLSVAAGPVGRSLGADITAAAAVYTYSRSQGVFAGVSLEGTVLVAEPKRNAAYYGANVSPSDILSGKILPPAGAKMLLATLEEMDRAYGIKPQTLPAPSSPTKP